MNVTLTQSCVRMAASIHMEATGVTVKLALNLMPTSHVKISTSVSEMNSVIKAALMSQVPFYASAIQDTILMKIRGHVLDLQLVSMKGPFIWPVQPGSQRMGVKNVLVMKE